MKDKKVTLCAKEVKELTEQIWNNTKGIKKADVKEVIRTLFLLQTINWVENRKMTIPVFGDIHEHEFTYTRYRIFNRETLKYEEVEPFERTSYKIKTKKTLRSANFWSEKFVDVARHELDRLK